MNAFLWVGVGATLLLVVAVVFDADVLDNLGIGGDWLTLPVLAAFVAAFGFGAGAFYDEVGAVALLPGAAAGALFGWLALRLTRTFQHMPTGVTDSNQSMVGSVGRVVTPNRDERTGEVLVDRPTGPVKVAFHAEEPLAIGTQVAVVEVRSATLVTVTALHLEL